MLEMYIVCKFWKIRTFENFQRFNNNGRKQTFKGGYRNPVTLFYFYQVMKVLVTKSRVSKFVAEHLLKIKSKGSQIGTKNFQNSNDFLTKFEKISATFYLTSEKYCKLYTELNIVEKYKWKWWSRTLSHEVVIYSPLGTCTYLAKGIVQFVVR